MKKDILKKYRRKNFSGEDIDMINDQHYEKTKKREYKNVCDTHEDGA